MIARIAAAVVAIAGLLRGCATADDCDALSEEIDLVVTGAVSYSSFERHVIDVYGSADSAADALLTCYERDRLEPAHRRFVRQLAGDY